MITQARHIGNLLLVALLAVSGCAPRKPSPQGSRSLGDVAACGDTPVAGDVVGAIAARATLNVRDALNRALFDACVSDAARARGIDRRATFRAALRAEHARALLSQLRDDARGPPTAGELARVREAHWRELDRPEAVRVVHAVALAKEGDHKARAEGRALAERVREATRGAQSAEAFEAAAKAAAGSVSDSAFRVEALPAFARDGRITEGGDGAMDTTFALAAHALQTPFDKSPLIDTAFGVHVIMLLERVPGARMGDDELAVATAEEVRAERGRAALDELLARLRSSQSVDIERSADESMAELDAGPQTTARH